MQNAKPKLGQASKEIPEKTPEKVSASAEKEDPTFDKPGEDLPVLVGVDETADIRQALQKKIDVEFVTFPLAQAVDYLAEEANVNMIIDLAALTEEGVATDELVEIVSKEVTVEHVLDRMLEPLGCTWIIRDEVVYVTTEIASGDEINMFVRSYRVPRELEGMESQQVGGEIKRSAEKFVWRLNDELFIDMIMTSTSGAWFDIDQEGGTISPIDGLLVVRQTFAVHEEVETLLEVLTDVIRKRTQAKAITIRGKTDDGAVERNAEALLVKKVSFEYGDVPLQDMMADLSKRTGIEFVIDEVALTQEGVAMDEPVSIVVKDVTLQSALNLAFEQLGLTLVFRHGVMSVTTEIASGDRLPTTVYVVDDILAAGKINNDEIIDLLMTQTSGPWFDIDQEGGVIGMWIRPTLVIRQTRKVHSEVAAVLAKLRLNIEERKPVRQRDSQEVVLVAYDWTDISDDGDQLMVAIKTMVASKTLSDAENGNVVFVVGNNLVIRQTRETHRAIQRFIEEIARLRTY